MISQLNKTISWFKSHPLPSAIIATILFVSATFGTFPDIYKRFMEYETNEENTHSIEKKVYWLGYDLGNEGLVYSDSTYLLSVSDGALNNSGLTREKLEKLSKLAKTEIFLMQSRYNQLKINIEIEKTISNIERQHGVAFGEIKDREVVKKLGLLTFQDIRESQGRKISNLFFIAFFSSMSKQNGLGMYTEEYQSDYIDLAPLVNRKLQENGLEYSIKERIDKKLGIINEVNKLDKFMISKYGKGQKL